MGRYQGENRCSKRFQALQRHYLTGVLGMPQLILQQVLGHSTLEMTHRYVKLSEEKALAAHRSYAVMDNLHDYPSRRTSR
jgi:hypothetical protein